MQNIFHCGGYTAVQYCSNFIDPMTLYSRIKNTVYKAFPPFINHSILLFTHFFASALI